MYKNKKYTLISLDGMRGGGYGDFNILVILFFKVFHINIIRVVLILYIIYPLLNYVLKNKSENVVGMFAQYAPSSVLF